jgi:hypothetical protein
VELRAFAATTGWAEFVAIREDVMLRVLRLVEEAGTRLAVPVQVEMAAEDTRASPDGTNTAVFSAIDFVTREALEALVRDEELDRLLPPYKQWQRRVGRWVRKLI